MQFKAKVKFGMKKRVFTAIDKQCALSFRLKVFSTKKEDKVKEQVIVALLKNLEKVRRLQNATDCTLSMHRVSVFRRFFA